MFVGSTFKELKEARQQIIDAILLTGQIPCGTELWPAEPQAPIGVIHNYLYPCDIHVLIVGHRYGSLVPNKDVSFTHWEYIQSKEAKRPLVVFLQEKNELRLSRDGLPASDPDRKHEEKFYEFLKELEEQKDFTLVYFSNTEVGIPKLAGQCIAALGRLTTSGLLPPSSGWIRADSYDGETLIAIEGNPFLKRVMDQIRQFEVLADRVTMNVGAKEAMSRHFWFYMQSRVRDWAEKWKHRKIPRPSNYRDSGSNLFFESGSTIAYVAWEFEQAVLNEAGVREDWHIRTNNILCLLQFELHTALDGRRFPDGKPDPRDKYGAIFPQDWGVLHREPPKRPRKDLSEPEKKAVRRLRAQFCQSERSGPTFVLATASGWDTDSDEMAFRGPHVGSHKNMLFKRVIFTSGYPVVLFLDAEKLGFKRQDNCYPVFDRKFPLTEWLLKFPIAICVGWEWPKRGQKLPDSRLAEFEKRNSEAYVRTVLKDQGFTKEYFCEKSRDENSGIRTGAILLANERFEREVPLLNV